MKRKITSLLIACSMLMPTVSMTASAMYEDTKGHWGETAITRWSEYGVVEGDENGMFNPDADMTRAQGAAILERLFMLNEEADISNFVDVNANDWHAKSIAKCVAAGIMNGVSDNKIDPNGTMTREQMFTMIGRAVGVKEADSANIPAIDQNSISVWAIGMINAMRNLGYIQGMEDGSVAPLMNINRASVMSLLNQTVTTYVNKSGTVTAVGTGITLVVADNVVIEGDADTVVIAGNGNSVEFAGSAKIVNVVGNGSKLDVSGEVDTVNIMADNVEVAGDGTVAEANVNGDNAKIYTKDTEVTIADGVTGTTVNDKPVDETQPEATPVPTKRPSGGSGGSGSSGSYLKTMSLEVTAPESGLSSNAEKVDVTYVNGVATIEADLSELAWSVSTDETQPGEHQWLAVYVNTSSIKTTDLKVNGSALDISEAQAVVDVLADENITTDNATGFIVWVKAEDKQYVDGRSFTLSADGYYDSTVVVKVNDTRPAMDVNVSAPISDLSPNSEFANVTYENGVVTITGDLGAFAKSDSSDPEQGNHKWLALYINTPEVKTEDLKFNRESLDASETQAVVDVLNDEAVTAETATGLILWVKAEDTEYIDGREIVLSSVDYKDEFITIKVVDIREDMPVSVDVPEYVNSELIGEITIDDNVITIPAYIGAMTKYTSTDEAQAAHGECAWIALYINEDIATTDLTYNGTPLGEGDVTDVRNVLGLGAEAETTGFIMFIRAEADEYVDGRTIVLESRNYKDTYLTIKVVDTTPEMEVIAEIPEASEENPDATRNVELAEVASDEDNVITVNAELGSFETSESSNPEQGAGKWLPIYINPSNILTTDLVYNETALVESDAQDVVNVIGGELAEAKGFVIWIKADDAQYVEGREISLKAFGYKDATVTIKVVDTTPAE